MWNKIFNHNLFSLKKYLVFTITMFVLLVILGVNFSNMNALSSNSKNVIGASREIRSDEWLRNTPMILSFKNQKNEPAQFSLLSAGNSKNAVQTFSVINFDQWLAKHLPSSQYFSYVFLSGIFSLIIFLPILLHRFGVRPKYAVLGTFIILFSPGNVWWSFQVGSIIGRFSGFLYFALLAVDKNHTRYSRAIYILLSSWIFSSLFYFYQPWVITCCLIFGPLCLNLIVKYRAEWKNLLSIFVFILSLMGWAFFSNRSAYQILQSTIYPGTRKYTGGVNQILDWMFSGPLAFALYNPKVKLLNTNQSEISLGFTVLILLGIFLILTNASKTLFKPSGLLLIGFGIVIIWTAFPIPFIQGNILSLISPQRALTFWTTACPLVMLFELAQTKTQNIRAMSNNDENYQLKKLNRNLGIFISLLSGFLILSSSIYFRSFVIPSYNLLNITISLAVICSFWIFTVHKKYFMGLFLFLIVSMIVSVPVNPVVRGTDQYFKNEFTEFIQNQPGDTTWVSDSMFTDAFLIANGAPSLSGQQFFGPNEKMWKLLDSKKHAKKFWNRGASYLVFNFDINIKVPMITSPQTDIILVQINPCSKELITLGVDYIVTRNKIEGGNCLILENVLENPFGLYVYNIKT